MASSSSLPPAPAAAAPPAEPPSPPPPPLSTLEDLLTVPLPFLARHTHNKKEAEAVLQVSLVAARLDSLLACLRTAADHAARAQSSTTRLLHLSHQPSSSSSSSSSKTDPRTHALLPLLKALELQRRHDLGTYQAEIDECAGQLER